MATRRANLQDMNNTTTDSAMQKVAQTGLSCKASATKGRGMRPPVPSTAPPPHTTADARASSAWRQDARRRAQHSNRERRASEMQSIQEKTNINKSTLGSSRGNHSPTASDAARSSAGTSAWDVELASTTTAASASRAESLAASARSRVPAPSRPPPPPLVEPFTQASASNKRPHNLCSRSDGGTAAIGSVSFDPKDALTCAMSTPTDLEPGGNVGPERSAGSADAEAQS
mmetsp:Transcript_11812/g.37902  ORF Transcript_11812/g.37902 Transcript_11812/m.37902 type:complete len:230 (-) Transcript_11812:126-815(-)